MRENHIRLLTCSAPLLRALVDCRNQVYSAGEEPTTLSNQMRAEINHSLSTNKLVPVLPWLLDSTPLPPILPPELRHPGADPAPVRALANPDNCPPRLFARDKLRGYPAAILELQSEGQLRRSCRHRTRRYANNRIESDHRHVKRRLRAMRQRIISGVAPGTLSDHRFRSACEIDLKTST